MIKKELKILNVTAINGIHKIIEDKKLTPRLAKKYYKAIMHIINCSSKSLDRNIKIKKLTDNIYSYRVDLYNRIIFSNLTDKRIIINFTDALDLFKEPISAMTYFLPFSTNEKVVYQERIKNDNQIATVVLPKKSINKRSFPKPLSAEVEAKFLKRCKNGDKDARDLLIEHNLRLVAHIVKKYYIVDKDIDNLISIGTIGLIKAIDTFDDEKGIRLATYATQCIDNEILLMLRNGKLLAKEIYLYEPIGLDKEGNEINLLDIIDEAEVDIVKNIVLEDDIKKLYHIIGKVLTDREREIISLRYGLNNKVQLSQDKVAYRLGISKSQVLNIEVKALIKLEENFRSAY